MQEFWCHKISKQCFLGEAGETACERVRITVGSYLVMCKARKVTLNCTKDTPLLIILKHGTIAKESYEQQAEPAESSDE